VQVKWSEGWVCGRWHLRDVHPLCWGLERAERAGVPSVAAAIHWSRGELGDLELVRHL